MMWAPEAVNSLEASESPKARRSAGGVVHKGAFYVVGGFGIDGRLDVNGVTDEVWRYDTAWRLLPWSGTPAARMPSLYSSSDGIYLFGGCGASRGAVSFLDDLWRYAERGWRRESSVTDSCPSGRYTNALAYYGGRLFVFGGYTENGAEKSFLGDLWAFDLASRSWQKLHDESSGPGRRYGFAWVADAHALYLFGGYDGEIEHADLWALELQSATWRCLDDRGGPGERYCPALGMVDGRIVVFGGRSKTRPKLNYADCWLFDPLVGWQEWTGPAPGYHAKAAYGSDGRRLWLFGGEGPSGHVSDLWTFDRSGWTRVCRARDDDPVLW